MGKIEYFSIILHKPNPVYQSGEVVAGTINIRVIERLKCNSISMVLNGRARVHWTETNGSGKNRSTRHYTANEQYLNANITFLAKQPSYDLYLEVGDYSYPFQIILPDNLPTSFEHYLGQVRYSINGTISIPWAFDNSTTRSFSVINNIDLNQLNPAISLPYGLEDTKVFCCGCCASEPVSIKFDIIKGGFVPGEPIIFNAYIDNRSDRELKKLRVRLKQHLKFHASGKTKSSLRWVTEIQNTHKVRPHSIENWLGGHLRIPSVCPSSNDTCRIIEISYSVIFIYGASNSIDSNVTIPITIGTIPLIQENETTISIPLAPSYEECMFGVNPNKELNNNIEKGEVIESDTDSFKPFYPVFRDYSV